MLSNIEFPCVIEMSLFEMFDTLKIILGVWKAHTMKLCNATITHA